MLKLNRSPTCIIGPRYDGRPLALESRERTDTLSFDFRPRALADRNSDLGSANQPQSDTQWNASWQSFMTRCEALRCHYETTAAL